MSRYDTNRRKGIRDPGIQGNWDKRAFDWLAEQAENYIAEWLDVRPLGDIGHGDKGWDLVYRGWHIDVKWTRYTPGRRFGRSANWTPGCPYLAVNAWKPLRADIYVLVMGETLEEFETYSDYIGWATREEVAKAPRRDMGYRRANGEPANLYCIGFDSLHRMQGLIDIAPRV